MTSPEDKAGDRFAHLEEMLRNASENARQWKAVAIGLGAHLEALEAHCAVRTGKTGQAHADEGKQLREAGRKCIALVYDQLTMSPNNPVLSPSALRARQVRT